MKSFIQSFLRFLGANAATVVALSSMLIALASLAVTIDTQREDRRYKELSIRPHVGVGAHVSDFNFAYTNAGYGHAFLARIKFGYGGKCYSSDTSPPDIFEENINRFYDKAANDLYLATVPVDMDRKQKDFNVTTSPLIIGETIRAGDKHSIFYFEPDTLKAVLLAKPNVLAQYRNAFARASSQLPILVTYCSATGQYCEDVPTADETCR